MDLFEYQAKSYVSQYSVIVPQGVLATTVEECVGAAEEIGLPVAVKGQVLSGSRGLAGAIQLCHDYDQVRHHAQAILAMDFDGEPVNSLWVEPLVDIADEFYASFTLDRSAKKHLLLFSRFGGVDIETVAQTNPEAIIELHICPQQGFDHERSLSVVTQSGIADTAIAVRIADTLVNLYRCYSQGDCDLAEINPLVVTESGDVIAVDAKISLDLNAAFRHSEWQEFIEVEPADQRERKAKNAKLQFISLDGDIGVIANGAGLAMSTIDVISHAGGSAANFCDIGGGSGSSAMASALEILASDSDVKAILVNVFGGITRCDNVANGIIEVIQDLDIEQDIVVRLDGTNAELGRQILADADTGSNRIHIAHTMLDAAQLSIDLASANTDNSASGSSGGTASVSSGRNNSGATPGGNNSGAQSSVSDSSRG